MIPYITKHSLRPKQRKKKNPPKGSFPVTVEGDEISMLPRSSSRRCHRRHQNHRLMMMMKGGHGDKSCYSLSRPSLSSLKSSFSATATKIKNTCVHVPVVIGSSIHKKLGGIASAPKMLGLGSTSTSTSTSSTPYQLSSSASYSSTSTTSFSESSSWKTSTCSKNQADSPSSFFFSSFGKTKKEGEIEDDDAVVDDTMKLVEYMDDDGSGSSSEDYEHQYEYHQQHEYHHQEYFLNAEDMNEI